MVLTWRLFSCNVATSFLKSQYDALLELHAIFCFITYSFGSKKVVIEGPKSLPGVIAAIGSAHEVFNYQSDVNQADAVVRGQVTLKTKRLLMATLSLCQQFWLWKYKQTVRSETTHALNYIHTHTFSLRKHTNILLEGIKIIEEDCLIHLEVDPTEPWIFLLGKNTQGQWDRIILNGQTSHWDQASLESGFGAILNWS